jgi:hypothetical protein
MSEEESTKYCTLCKLDFNLFNWKVRSFHLLKYVCQNCQRLVCQSCGPHRSQAIVGSILCDPCLNGIDAKEIIVDPMGCGWSVTESDDWNSFSQ